MSENELPKGDIPAPAVGPDNPFAGAEDEEDNASS